MIVDHPVAEIRVGSILRLQEVGRLELVLRQAYQVGECHDEQDGPITAPMRAGVQKEVLASAMKENGGRGYIMILNPR